MKKTKEQTYQELSKEYSDSEIAESFVFSSKLPETQQQSAEADFLKLRMAARENMSDDARLRSQLFTFKLSLRDYFSSPKFDEQFSFAQQIKRYISITGRSNNEIADNLNVHKTKLSRLVNGKEKPNTELMYRLERHSEGEIPAYYWWRLLAKELEYKLKTDHNKREEEASKVSNPLSLRA